jgi:phage terminase large subunit-like protein
VSLFEVDSLPIAPADRGTWRRGTRNAARQAKTTSAPPWAEWRRMSLPARCVRFLETYCIPSKGHRHGAPLTVAGWQSDYLEQILATGVTSSGLTLPRGNGKSTFTGGLGLWALVDPAVAEEFGGQPQIPVVATSLKQARRGVYGAAVAFSRNHPEIDDRVIRYTAAGDERIVAPFNFEGELFPVADDVDTLQGLDPMIALIDEFGFVSVAAWDSLLLAGGKRPRSLTIGLGTRNPDDTPNALDHLVAQLVTHGNVDGFVFVDYSADPGADPDDRSQWLKANPALAAGYLEENALATARKLSPAASFKCFRLNIKGGAITGWLGADGPAHWDATNAAHRPGTTSPTITLDPDEPTLIGVDKSAYNDCSAVAALQRYGPDAWQCVVRIFHPEGGAISHAAVKTYLRELAAELNVEAIGYDDRYFVEGAQELEDEGLPLVKVPQTPQRMVPAYSHLYRDIITHRLFHDDDPVLRSHVLGAVPVVQASGGFTLGKNRSHGKIDGIVALAIARSLTSVELEHAPADESFRIR